jgi:hypothetical protein
VQSRMGSNGSILSEDLRPRFEGFSCFPCQVEDENIQKIPEASKEVIKKKNMTTEIDPHSLRKKLVTSPSWKQDPTPLPGWTVEEQRKMIECLKALPEKGKRDSEIRDKFFGQLIRSNGPLEGKTLVECDICFKHVERNRIAFFGGRHSASCSSLVSSSSRSSKKLQ